MSDWREAAKIKIIKLRMDKKRVLEMADRLYHEGMLHSGERKLLEEIAVIIEREIQEIEFMFAVEEVLSGDMELSDLILNTWKPDQDSDDV